MIHPEDKASVTHDTALRNSAAQRNATRNPKHYKTIQLQYHTVGGEGADGSKIRATKQIQA